MIKIISLGGFGQVTKNMFVYENEKDILVVDCGVGFPSNFGRENDLSIPDTEYLEQRRNKIRGIILTHGHEDHVGALPFILPKLGLQIPIFASRLTVALVQQKLAEFNLKPRIVEVDSGERVNFNSFLAEFVYVTHSIPDTFNLALHTTLGTIFHAPDFKFDWTPVMGRQAEVGKIALIGNQGVLCLLSDCLRSEKAGYTLSEAMIEDSFEREIRDCRGRVFITTMSSNVSRWQQAINVSLKYHRKIVLVGRSIEKIIETAVQLGYLKIPRNSLVRVRNVNHFASERLTFLVAGSQGQMGSALTRITAGTHHFLKVEPKDKVIFSADYIPGNELAIHGLVDDLSRLGATVSYSEILDDLHVSGHAAQAELALMINLLKPKYLVPIGGAFRQMKQYSLLAQKMGYKEENILLPDEGQTITFFEDGRVSLGEKIRIKSNLIKTKRTK